MTLYLRRGNTYQVTDKADLNLYETLPAGNYTVKIDMYGNYYLELIENFTSPKKVYGDVEKNVTRILNTYLDRTCSTGVMLSGEKGSGKTLLSKQLSIVSAKQGIPTIVINESMSGDGFNRFIQDITQPSIILFDEFEKVYSSDDQEAILTLLDGVYPTKKLFIFTCNNRWRIDTNMRNRPGRIYYMIEFKGLESSFIQEYCQINLNNKQYIDNVCNISKLFSEFNFDMLQSLIEEMNRYNEPPQDAMRLLNAKPEFSSKSDYNVELIVKGVKIKDVCNEIWNGNPVNDAITIDFIKKSRGNNNNYVSIEFNSSQLDGVNPDDGSFIFYNNEDQAKLLLTKKISHTFDYLSAF